MALLAAINALSEIDADNTALPRSICKGCLICVFLASYGHCSERL